jgi:hypothetical protein
LQPQVLHQRRRLRLSHRYENTNICHRS